MLEHDVVKGPPSHHGPVHRGLLHDQVTVRVRRRCSALRVDVVVSLTERDAAVERYERAAGVALAALINSEGLTIADACEWAGDLTVAEAKRLRRLAIEGGERDG